MHEARPRMLAKRDHLFLAVAQNVAYVSVLEKAFLRAKVIKVGKPGRVRNDVGDGKLRHFLQPAEYPLDCRIGRNNRRLCPPTSLSIRTPFILIGTEQQSLPHKSR